MLIQRRNREDKTTWGLGGPVVRLGFRQIKGMREADAHRIVSVRKVNGPFVSIAQVKHLAELEVSVLHRSGECRCFCITGFESSAWHMGSDGVIECGCAVV